MKIAVAVAIYFDTIIINYKARLEAFICHTGSGAHGMVIEGGAIPGQIRPHQVTYDVVASLLLMMFV